MKVFGKNTIAARMSKNRFGIKGLGVACVGVAGLAFGLSACGDSTSAEDNPSDYVVPLESSSSVENGPVTPGSSSEPGEIAQVSSSSTVVKPASSSSKKVETVTSEEQLNEPSMIVNGACGPKNPIIEKGGMATWEFFRESGDVFDAIMAPYVWNFIETGKTLKGNGMNSVNVTYEEPGTYTAVLNVDGTEVACEPLQVQGIPVVVNSCKADKETAKAGETITWTVDAESEAAITGYAWTSADGEVSGASTSATMLATSEMHKKSVSVVVAVTNNDKTTQTYTCQGVTVLDPESVDMVLGLGNINSSDFEYKDGLVNVEEDAMIPASTPLTIQIPAGAKSGCTVGCKPRNSGDYMSTTVTWDDEELTNFAYFSPAGCAAGKKYSVSSTAQLVCVVNAQ